MDNRKQRIAILISGRGGNMEAIVRNVREGSLRDCCEVLLVVSSRADAPGLGRASALGFPIASLDAKGALLDKKLLALLEPLRLDWLVLAGWMRILSPAVIRRYPERIVNIHPADTRAHQGLGGYRWAFERKLESTSVTVHLVDEGLDTGRILAQRSVDLRGAKSLADVEQRGLAVEHALYSEALRDLFTKGDDS